jgi:hypothetical protein
MVKRTVPVTEALANPQVTLTPQALQALLDEVKASREALIQAKLDNDALRAEVAEKPAKGDSSAKNEMACIKAFKKKFNVIVKPKVDVLTFNKWVDQGLRPKEGEHAVKVANLRLFHKSQCRPLTKAEAGDFAKKFREQEAKRSAKVTPLHQPA